MPENEPSPIPKPQCHSAATPLASGPERAPPASVCVGPPPESFILSVAAMGLEVEPAEIERLRSFLQILLEANEQMNLTAITDPDQAWTKHILDALTLVPVLATLEDQAGMAAGSPEIAELPNAIDPTPTPDKDASPPLTVEPAALRVVDVGSGGGVPAIPLAIVLPHCHFALVEATGKKADFLRAACSELRLSNVSIINERAEVVGQARQHREMYDAAIARALGHLAIVCELCAPLVRPSGVVIAVKGQKAQQELLEAERALGLLGLRHVDTSQTPTGRLVLLEKTTRTPRIYPRSNGEPSRVPLGVPRARR